MMDNNNFNNDINESSQGDGKGIFFAIVGVMTVVVAIAGATYAYFAATATNNNTIKGDSAYNANGLKLTIAQSSDGTGKLIPQLDSAILLAIAGTDNNSDSVNEKCVDGNGSTICKVYTITVTNDTTTTMNVRGTLTLTAANMPNLKWSKGTSETAGFTTYNDMKDPEDASTSLSTKTFDLSDEVIAGGANKIYYIVVWISETNNAQTDSGSFTGQVDFSGYIGSGENEIGGVTSTIRG